MNRISLLEKKYWLKQLFHFKLILPVKLTLAFLFLFLLQAFAKFDGQTVTLKEKNISLGQLVKQIKKQTGYKFVYENKVVEKAGNLTVDFTKAPFETVLAYCSLKTGLRFEIKLNTIVISQGDAATKENYNKPVAFTDPPPPIDITGKVVDEESKPLPGAAVLLKGSGTGTSTDAEGNFKLTLPNSNGTLVISYVGYETREIAVPSVPAAPIVLKRKIQQADDVVVIGYGTQKKGSITGSVSLVDTRVLTNRSLNNAINALQGAAPGLVVTRSSGQPGKEGWNLNIRGTSSLNGTNRPLMIIDGVEGNIANLNPDDIGSVSVLKDAASAAIYGAKSSGGVVIVTTKKGSSGKINVSYTGIFNSNQFYGIPERLHSWEEAEMANLSRKNAGQADAWTQQQIGWMKNPDSSFQNNQANPALNGYYYDLNQIPIVMRKSSPSFTNNLSVSGGDQKNQYLISAGAYTQDGVFKFGPDKTTRYNARFNLATRFNSIFSLDSRIAYTQKKTLSPQSGVNADGGLLYQVYQLRTIYPVFLPGTNDTKYALTGSGPTACNILKDGGYFRENQYNLDAVFTLKANNIVKDLTLTAIYSPHLEQYNANSFAKTIELWSFGTGSAAPRVGGYINNPNAINKTRQTVLIQNTQALADYDLAIDTRHHFHLLGGFEYQYYNFDNIGGTARALISNDIPSLNLGGNASVIPSVGDNIQKNTWLSYFGRFNYEYKQKYLLQATVRSDASSRLAPAYRTQTFTTVSAGWVVNKEPWFENSVRFLNLFKLRASWGQQGNAQLGELNENNYNYIASLSNGGNYPFNNIPNRSIFQSSLPSSALGWEVVEQTDAGVDFAFFTNRLNGSFDYFIRRNNNMLISVNFPATLGVSPGNSNAASMKTWGWEVTLGWRDRINKFNYWVNFNIGDNNNKITKYLGNIVIGEGVNRAITDYPVNSIFGYVDQGYFSDTAQVSKHAFQDSRTGPGDIIYKDVDGNGRITGGTNTLADHGDLVHIGNTSPRYNFGLNLGFDWKGFDFSAFFQGTGERYIMLSGISIVPFANTWRMPWAINTDYWTPDNTDARFPRLYNGGSHNTRVSSHWVQNAAYIRLKSLQAGYTLPQTLTARVKIAKARIFFTGENIFTSAKMWYNYYDPEEPNNVSFNYPFYRSFAAGININF